MSLSDLQQAKAQILALKQQIAEQMRSVFDTESAKLFQTFPELESFSWRQYTPYFNDGEECVFSVGTEDALVNDEDVAWDETKRSPMQHAVLDFLCIFDDDDYRRLFDNHVQVTVTADGIDVQEYDHD